MVRKFIGPKSRFLAQKSVFYTAWHAFEKFSILTTKGLARKIIELTRRVVRKVIGTTRGPGACHAI